MWQCYILIDRFIFCHFRFVQDEKQSEDFTEKFVFGFFYFGIHKVLFVNLPTFSTAKNVQSYPHLSLRVVMIVKKYKL